MNRTFSLPGVLLAIAATLFHSGCTALGYIAGSAIDDGNERIRALSHDDLMTLHPGADLRVVTLDSSAVEGNLVGIRLAPGNPYRERFRDFRDQADSSLGILDFATPVSIVVTSGAPAKPRTIYGIFQALSKDSLWLQVQWKYHQTTFSYGVGLDEIQSITGDSGTSLEGTILRRYAGQPGLPTPYALVMTTDDGPLEVSFDETARVDLVERGSGGRIGLTAIGLGLDAAAVYLAISSMNLLTFEGMSLFPAR
jgi:hypothetical protein